jgi:hypothetical protein
MVPGHDPGVCPVCEQPVEGGCHTCAGPAIPPEQDQARRDLARAAEELGGEPGPSALARRFQEFIDANAGQDPPPAEHFTLDGAAFYRVTQGQWRELMELAPQEIRDLNDANPPAWPGSGGQLRPGELTAEQEALLARLTVPQPGEDGLARQEREQEGPDPDWPPGLHEIHCGPLGERDDRCSLGCGCPHHWGLPVPPLASGLSDDEAVTVLTRHGYGEDEANHAVADAMLHGMSGLPRDHAVWYQVLEQGVTQRGVFAVSTKVPVPGKPGHFLAGPPPVPAGWLVRYFSDVAVAARLAGPEASEELTGQPMVQQASLELPPPPFVPGRFFLLAPAVRRLLLDIEAVDAHLDDPAVMAPAFRDSEVANRMRRVAKPMTEANEAYEEMELFHGSNPRKGQDPEAYDRMLAELGDTACCALLAIQSQTKNLSQTWNVFLAAVAKARSRVPAAPGPDGCGGTCSCHGDTGSAVCGTCCSGTGPPDAVFPPESGMSDQHARDNGITG